MKVIVLANEAVIDGIIRRAGDVVQVPDDFVDEDVLRVIFQESNEAIKQRIEAEAERIKKAKTARQALRTLHVSIKGQGAVTQDPEGILLPVGTEVKLKAKADNKWKFVDWSGAIVSDKANISFILERDMELTVTFEATSGQVK